MLEASPLREYQGHHPGARSTLTFVQESETGETTLELNREPPRSELDSCVYTRPNSR